MGAPRGKNWDNKKYVHVSLDKDRYEKVSEMANASYRSRTMQMNKIVDEAYEAWKKGK